MSRTITLVLLRDDIRFQADLIGATVRHTDAQLTRLINQSIQEFREAISNDGNTHYLVPYSGTLGTGATSPYSFYSLDLSAISPSIVRTYGIDVTIDNVVHSLDHRPFTERNIWGGPATTGIPKHWAHYQTAKLAIQPAPSEAHAYTLWYLPVLADLSGDSDTFNGVAGWEAWIVWDCVCRLLIRDQQTNAYSVAKQYRDDVWDRIKRNATRVSSAGGAVVGRDSLRGRIPDFLAARGPVMAGGGLPPSGSVTLDMMADMTGPAVIGRESGTGRPVVVGQTGIVSSIIPAFTPGLPGLVPAAGGSSTTLFLSQAGTFLTPAGGGGGGGSPGGPTGSIQFAGLSGFVGYTGFAVQGSPPSMTVRLPGSLRVTGGTVDVGSGTVRISGSGIDMGDGSLRFAGGAATGSIAIPQQAGAGIFGRNVDDTADIRLVGWPGSDRLIIGGSGVARLEFSAGTGIGRGHRFTFDDGSVALNITKTGGINRLTHFGDATINGGLSLGTGLTNDSLHPMASGTVKANLGPTGAPQDVSVATLFAAIPTFTSLLPGFVPPSGGGTDNFLRADGNFAIPPGVGSSPSGITNAQLGPMNSGTVKMRVSGTGVPEDVVIPTLFAFFPTFSSALPGLVPPSGGGTTNFLRADGAFAAPPASGTPTGITLAQFNPIATPRILGRISSPSGIPEEIIPTLIATLLPHFSDTGRGMVPASGGGLSNFLRADGNFAAPTGFVSVPTGLPNSNLAVMPTGTIKGNLSGTGAPADVPFATFMAFAPTFTSARAGVVPPSDGAATSFLAGDAVWRAPSGAHQFPPAAGVANAQLATVASGTVKGSLTNTNPSDLPIPTLAAFFPTMTSTRAGLVGPGGGTLTNFLRGDGQFAAPTGFTFTPTGLPNANLAVMPSGTVKMNLSGTAAPADVLVPTLMTLMPTFTSTVAGTVPPSGGGTSNFLRADGGWAVPPGGAASPGGGIGNVQYNNGVGFAGGSGVNIVGSGVALGIGPTANIADRGDFRVGSGYVEMGRNASGIAQPIVEFWNPTGTIKFGGSGLARLTNEVASGGVQEFIFGGVTGSSGKLLPTGLDFTAFHAVFKSLAVPNINGYPADSNYMTRGSVTWMASGLRLYVPKGASTGANRFVVPTGALGTNITVTLWPSGARGGNTIRIERLDRSAGTITIQNPSGTALYIMPSGTAEVADFVFTKPSGTAFEHGGNAGLF